MLLGFGPSLFIANGPPVSFYGFPYPTRMAVVQLASGALWVWSPVALTDELAAEVAALGPVRYIVSPNRLHHLFLSAWARRWPEARLYAPPGLAAKRPDLHFHGELGDTPDPAWAQDIDQAVFRGSFALTEVVFFHARSRTAIVGDLIQRFDTSTLSAWKGLLLKLDGLAGEHGSTPRELRITFLRRGAARAARDKVLGWQPEQLLIAHGRCVQGGATPVVDAALAWM
ncbi:MAG TPA: DUF4336 domain-containing protein [Burkholderiaceae bacterium]